MLKFNADLFRLVSTARSFEETRYYLNGVYVCPAQVGVPGVYLIATDGHRLLWGYDAQGAAPKGGIIVQLPGNKAPGADFKAVKKETARRVEVDTTGEEMLARIVVTQPNGEDVTVGTALLHAVDAEYPDCTRVVPKHLGKLEGSAPSFQGRYLADLGKLAADYAADRANALHIRADSESGPALVTFGRPGIRNGEGIGLFGVLMPIRSGDQAGEIPAWFYAAPKATQKAA